MMWTHRNSVPREHLNLIKMSIPEPQIRYFHTHHYTTTWRSPPTYTHTHLQAHIHTTHTDTDVTTRQAYRSHTEQTHIYTDTNTPQTYAHVATYTHTHTHINIRYTHMVLYTITCLPKISERDSAEYSIISLLFLHCIHWKKFARKIGTWYFQTLHLY